MNEMTTYKTTGVTIGEMIKAMTSDTEFVEEEVKSFAAEGESFISALFRYLYTSLDSLTAEVPSGEDEDAHKVGEYLKNVIRFLILPAEEFDGNLFNEWLMKLTDLLDENPMTFASIVSDEQQEETDEE